MRSRQLETALADFLDAAASHLSADVAAGAEVPFELGSTGARRGQSATPLYCYRALTGPFIAEREPALKRLAGHAEVAKLLEGFDGLDRYLASMGADPGRAKGRARVRAAIKTLMEDVFEEQSDFQLRPERLRAALDRLEQSAFASASQVTLVATLHGLTIASTELQLTKGLTIAHRDALQGMPDGALAGGAGGRTDNHLIVVHTAEDDDPQDALLHGCDVLKDLLCALRLFGDGRITLGALAWARIGPGPWSTLAVGTGGRPHGMLVVTAEHEDELRAFCNLVSRRAPHGNELAWALRRFELGCERETPCEALTDHLLALRALLEPEGPSSGLLAGRLAALCATPEQRLGLTRRIVQAVSLERDAIAGTAVKPAADALAEDVANHLRALLRDVICGHLMPDLVTLADELLDAPSATDEDSGDARLQAVAEEADPQAAAEQAQPGGVEDEAEPEEGENEAHAAAGEDGAGPERAAGRAGAQLSTADQLRR
jgi:hypothetical protein